MSSSINNSLASSLPSIAVQKTFVGSYLNEDLALIYVLGIYTGVYAVATYIYLHKGGVSTFHKALVIGTLTASYIVLNVSGSIEIYTDLTQLRKAGYSRKSLFDGSTHTRNIAELDILESILNNASFMLSDGLLLWRCFHACGRSLARLTLLLGLFTVEFVLILVHISLLITGFRNSASETGQRGDLEHIVLAAIFGTVGATSITSTVLICRTIYVHGTNDGQSRIRFKYIADILIQSSAIYSTAMFLSSIFVITVLWTQATDVEILEEVVVTLAIGMTGFLPTLMVARLAVGAEQEEQSTECLSMSLLRFADPDPMDEEAAK